MREWFSIYLKGVFMGAADAVPGVSGGTIALITGIYERLVGAIAAFDPSVLADLPRAYDAEARGRIAAMLREMDIGFLLVLGTGVITAVVAVTGLLEHALAASPGIVFAFFAGLILASAVVLWSEVGLDTSGEIAAAVVGFAAAFLVAGISAESGLPHSIPLLFLAGALGISAMVLPGVSGSLLLLLLGQYEFMVGELQGFIDALLAGSVGSAGDFLGNIVAFLAGAAVGILTFARVVEWALSNYHQLTLTFLVALMVGALRYPVAKVFEETAVWTPTTAAAVLTAGLVGAFAVLLVDYYTDDLDYVEDDPTATPAARND
jgi:putative membrane protein